MGKDALVGWLLMTAHQDNPNEDQETGNQRERIQQPGPQRGPQRGPQPEAQPDPMALIIELESGLEFTKRGTGQHTSYVAHDRRTGRYFRFGLAEYHAVTLMDGSRTIGQIADQLTLDGVQWTAMDLVAFAKEITDNHLTRVLTERSTDHQTESQANKQLDCGDRKSEDQRSVEGLDPRKLFSFLLRCFGSILSQRFPIANGDRIAERLLPTFGVLFSKWATFVWIAFVSSGIAIAWQNSDEFAQEFCRVFDKQLWVVLAVLWFGLKIIHECGHAVCAKYHGVRVGKMGVMFFLFAPLAYVDVTDAWKLVRRRDRVQIALAGVYVELAIGAAAAWFWWYAPTGFSRHFAAQVFLVAGPATILVNANPLLRLDGYYVLSDLLEIPNLRSHGRKRLVGMIEWLLFRLPKPDKQLIGWRNDFALFHAICSVVFQVVWMTGLVVAVSQWAKGLGIALAFIAALMWGVFPSIKWMHRIWSIQPRRGLVLSVYQRRLLAFCALAAVVLQYAAIETSPFRRRVPVVVRYQNEQISRAPSNAFVTSVYVRCGDRVQKGDLLIELEQPELLVQHDELNDRRAVANAKSIQHHRRGELSLAATESENAESLQRQIDEIDGLIRGLRVLAERDGRITSPFTDELLGRYVNEGDELIRVSDPQEKELLAIIAEDNLEAYSEAAMRNRTAGIRLRGGVKIRSALTPLQPSASRMLPHPALAATAGGPLAVQAADESPDESSDGNRLVQPQLRSVLPLDPYASLAVKAGQVGRLTIPDDRTLVSRVWDHLNPE